MDYNYDVICEETEGSSFWELTSTEKLSDSEFSELIHEAMVGVIRQARDAGDFVFDWASIWDKVGEWLMQNKGFMPLYYTSTFKLSGGSKLYRPPIKGKDWPSDVREFVEKCLEGGRG